MNERLRRRLKQLHNVDDNKIAALSKMFSDAQLAALLDQVERADGIAIKEQIAYKGARMSTNTDYDRLDAAYTLLDTIKDRRGLPAATAAADCAVTMLRDIEAGRATIERDGTRYKARYKASDLYSQAVAALGQEQVDQVLQALLDKAAGAGGIGKVSSSGDGSKAVAKAAPDMLAAAFQGPLTSDRRPR